MQLVDRIKLRVFVKLLIKNIYMRISSYSEVGNSILGC